LSFGDFYDRHLAYFIAIWQILWHLFPVWACFIKENLAKNKKSGNNLATLV
jgi:hypothetical protein